MVKKILDWSPDILRAILWFLVGVFVISAIHLFTTSIEVAECKKLYSLTSQSLDCAEYEDTTATLDEMEEKVNELVENYKKDGRVERVSVWVRDLNTRQWLGVNEFEIYAPASLFKVPLMIAYYKVAEADPRILTRQLTYQKNELLNSDSQITKSQTPLVPGESYSVETLIERMIQESNNDAAALLLSNLDPAIFENTLIELGIRIPQNEQVIDFVTVKTYANVYRILYNASYLNRASSQKALEVLSASKFKGLAETVPGDVTVSHKFGEREAYDNRGTVLLELHDCGIVYKASGPYTLCIMSEGKSYDALLESIQEISAIIYEQL